MFFKLTVFLILHQIGINLLRSLLSISSCVSIKPAKIVRITLIAECFFRSKDSLKPILISICYTIGKAVLFKTFGTSFPVERHFYATAWYTYWIHKLLCMIPVFEIAVFFITFWNFILAENVLKCPSSTVAFSNNVYSDVVQFVMFYRKRKLLKTLKSKLHECLENILFFSMAPHISKPLLLILFTGH